MRKEEHWYYYFGGGMKAEIIRIPGHGYKSIVNEYWEEEHRTMAEAMTEILSYSEIGEAQFKSI